MPGYPIRLSASVATSLVLVASSIAIAQVRAADCKSVRGHLEETLVPPPQCTSPVGLCTVAQMFGHLRGEARFTAMAFIASADTPATGVVFVIGDSTVVDARLGDKRGTLNIKNAAAVRTVGDGDLSDTQLIVGGSGNFANASGSLRISGNFVGTSGSAGVEGTVCVP